MNHFFNILKYAKPYKRLALGHIISNIFYALFGALSFIALIPMLDVLFKEDITNGAIKSLKKPVYQGISHLNAFYKDSMAYLIDFYAHDDKSKALLIVIVFIIILFLLKNIFGYLANYFMVFLRNGVVKDIRNAVYKKTVELPLSYFSVLQMTYPIYNIHSCQF